MIFFAWRLGAEAPDNHMTQYNYKSIFYACQTYRTCKFHSSPVQLVSRRLEQVEAEASVRLPASASICGSVRVGVESS